MMARLKTVPRGLRGGVLGRLGGSWAALVVSWVPNVIPLMTFSKSTTFCNGYATKHKSIKAKPNDSIHRCYLIASRIPPGRAVERMSVDDMVQNYCCIERTSATHESHR